MSNALYALTSSFDDWLLDSLRDPDEARHWLAVALEEFRADGDAGALAGAVARVLQAQQGREAAEATE